MHALPTISPLEFFKSVKLPENLRIADSRFESSNPGFNRSKRSDPSQDIQSLASTHLSSDPDSEHQTVTSRLGQTFLTSRRSDIACLPKQRKPPIFFAGFSNQIRTAVPPS